MGAERRVNRCAHGVVAGAGQRGFQRRQRVARDEEVAADTKASPASTLAQTCRSLPLPSRPRGLVGERFFVRVARRERAAIDRRASVGVG